MSTCTEEEEKKRIFPQVRTFEVESITAEGALFKGEIREYPQPVTERGFMWSLTESYVGLITTVNLGPTSTGGTFEATITHDLKPDQVYYVWAYAKTSTHTVNGEIKSFRSLGSKAPVVHSIEPKLVTWGDTLVIKGENFSLDPRNVSASIGATSLPMISCALAEIKVKVPLDFHGPKGKVKLSVLNNAAAVADSIELKAPAISSIEPLEGRHGDEVTISGSYFHPAVGKVYFGAVEAEVISRSMKSIKCRIPAELPGGLAVVTVWAGNQSVIAGEKFHNKVGFITGFSPGEGTFGDQVTISGEHFDLDGLTTVFFGKAQAPIVSMTETEIVVNVPSPTMANPVIKIINNGPTLTAGAPFRILPPEIHSYSEVVEGASDHITITGKNFNPGGYNAVFFDNIVATTIALSATELQAEIPPGIGSNEVSVMVEGVGGRAEAEGRLKVRWAYRNLPLYFSVPTSGLKVLYHGRLYAGIQNGSARWHMLIVDDLSVGEPRSFPGRTRFGYGYFVIGDYLYIAGGFVRSATFPFSKMPISEVWAYHLSTNSWAQRADLPFTGVSDEMVGFSHDNKGFLIDFGKLYRYYPETDTWIQKDVQLPETVSGQGVLVGNNYFFKPESNHTTHAVMRYDVVSDVWETMTANFDLTSRPTFAFPYKGRPAFGNDQGVTIYDPSSNQWITNWFFYPRDARFGYEYLNAIALYDEYGNRIFTFREDY